MSSLLYLMLGRCWQVAISIIYTKLVVNLLSDDKLSIFYFALSIIMFLGLFIAGPIGNYFTRNYLENDKNEIISFLIKSTIASSFFVLIFSFYLCMIGTNYGYYIIVLIVFDFFINTILRSFLSILNLEGKQNRFVLYNNLPLTTTVSILSFVFYFYGIVNVELILSSLLFGKFVSIFILCIKEIKFQFVKINIDLKKTLSFCIPLSIGAFLVWLQSYSYRFILDYKDMFILVGVLGALQTLSTQFVSNVQSIFVQYFNPKYFRYIAESKNHDLYWLKGLFFQMSLYAFILILSSYFSEQIIHIFLKEEFTKYRYVFVFLMASEVLKAINNHINLIYHQRQNTTYIILSSSFGLMSPLLVYFFASDIMTVALYLLYSSAVVVFINILTLIFLKRRPVQ